MNAEKFACEWCGKTTNRQGDEFTQDSLAMHRLRCRKRPSPTVGNDGGNYPSKTEVVNDGGKSMKSPSPTVADPVYLSPPLGGGKEDTGQPSSAVPDDDEESIAALWSKHRNDRKDNGRPVFNTFEQKLMARNWRYLKARERDIRKGIVAALRAHADQVAFDEVQEAVEREIADKASASTKAFDEEWAREQVEREARTAAWAAELAARPVEVPKGPPVYDPFFPPREFSRAEQRAHTARAGKWTRMVFAFLDGALDTVPWSPESRAVYEAESGRKVEATP